MIQLGEQKCSKDLSLSVQCPADLFSIGLLWPETFFLVSLFAISASFRAVSQSAVLPGAWKSYNRIVQSLLFDDESWMNIWSAFNIISVQQSPHPENHCIVFDSVVDQNISLPILLLSISSSIIIWLTFSSIWGIVIKLGKYLDKFCFIDLKKKQSFSLWLHPFLRRLWVPLSWGCLTLQSRKQPWNSLHATRNTVT